MGVDTRIYLPGVVSIEDASNVVGIAAGLHAFRLDLDHHGTWGVRVIGVTVTGIPYLPRCAEIHLVGPMVDGSTKHFVLWHWEGGHGTDRLLMPRSTPFWQAIGRTLVEFFGGTLDLCDCDDKSDDLVIPNQYPDGLPSDGEPWQAFQEKIFNVRPIPKEMFK